MTAVATKVPVRILEDREPRGYVGPCCDSGCSKPATSILTLNVNGLIVTAWTCDMHAKELAG